VRPSTRPLRADDGIRTRDPHLGKVMLYQLSHVRVLPGDSCPPATSQTLADTQPNPQLGNASRGAAVTGLRHPAEHRGRNVVACPDPAAVTSFRRSRGHGRSSTGDRRASSSRYWNGRRRRVTLVEGHRPTSSMVQSRSGHAASSVAASDMSGRGMRRYDHLAGGCSAVGSSTRRATPHTPRTHGCGVTSPANFSGHPVDMRSG
jgi:hypothetical protein